MKKFIIIFSIIFCLVCNVSFAEKKVLFWKESPSTDVKGYKIYWGPKSGYYIHFLDVGNVTQYVVNLPGKIDVYSAVTAYDTSLNESKYSNEIHYVNDDTTPPLPPTHYEILSEVMNGLQDINKSLIRIEKVLDELTQKN